MTSLRLHILLVLVAAFALAACADSGSSGADVGGDALAGETSQGDTGPVPADSVFRFGVDPGQSLTAAPFPNNLYLSAEGVALAPLSDDPALAGAANAASLTRWTELIAEREGFGFTSALRFFMEEAPDLASAEGRVRFVALAGPEAGQELAAMLFWDARLSALGVFPAWGHSMLPDSTYAVLIERGVTTASGATIEAPPAFLAALGGASAESLVNEAWAPVRTWLDETGAAAGDFVIGTVFTTEPSLPLGQALFAAVDDYPLAAPMRAVRWDAAGAQWVEAEPVTGAELDRYFGVATAPYEDNPAFWSQGARGNAGALAGLEGPYEGGTAHPFIGAVYNGSLRVPAFNFHVDGEGALVNTGFQRDETGALTWSLETIVPFTLFLCDSHVADPAELPVAVFTHGGTGERLNAVSYANLNCANAKMATLALDQPFHGGRSEFALLAEEAWIVPTRRDDKNALSGLASGEEGFVPDHQGDGADATVTVGALYGLAYNMDPAIVESNLLTIAAESYAAVRYVREGDWSALVPGLSFAPDKVFHESLSYGSSFTAALLALSDDLRGVVSSVGAGYMVSANLTMAPANGALAASIIPLLIGTPASNRDLQRAGYEDFALSMVQWLSERGDPLAWAPYVLRHRQDDHELSLLSSGDSWDETLYTPPQITFNNAFGLEVRTAGAEWTLDPAVPGAESVEASAYDAPLAGNLSFGGRTHTGVLFYKADSCHSQTTSPICEADYESEPAPPAARAEAAVSLSPVCALHTQADHFLRSLLEGATHGEVVAPAGDCAGLFRKELPPLPTKAHFPAPADPFAGGADASCAIYQAERCEGGVLQTCAVYDTASASFVGEVDPLLHRAYLYDRWRDLYHRADGQLLERVFVGETLAGTPEEIWGADEHFAAYAGGGDSGIWTGWAVTAAILRYVNTGTEADYQRMEDWVRGLLVKWDVTGIPGYLSRSHYIQVPGGTPRTPAHNVQYGEGPDNWMHRPIPNPQGVEDLPAAYWQGYEDAEGVVHQGTAMWAGRTSIDQASGSMVSLPMAWNLLRDEALKAKIVHQLTCYLHRLQRVELINLQQNAEALQAFMDYFGGGQLMIDEGDIDFSQLDRVVGYVQRQINTLNEGTFDTSCPDSFQLAPWRVIDAAAPSFVLDLLGFVTDMGGYEQERSQGIDHYYFPAIRGGDAMHLMHLATMAYHFTGDERYREFLYDELIGHIRTVEVAHTAGAFDPPNTCKKWYGDQITFGPWWAFLHLLDDCPLKTELQQAFHTEFWEKLMYDSGNADFNIMYAGAVPADIALARDPALIYALEQLARMGGNGGVLDDPRRQYTLTPEQVLAAVVPDIQPRCPTVEEIDECETEIVFLGVPLPGLTATRPCTGSEWECVIDGERCAPREADHALPVDLRPYTDYLWQRNPFELGRYAAVEGRTQYPGSDYSVPYWNARQYGFIEAGAGQVLAWQPGGSCN